MHGNFLKFKSNNKYNKFKMYIYCAMLTPIPLITE